jgi:hypothetical protein
MDDNAPKENPPQDFNKIDLTQLQGFSFGTQWTQDKNAREARPDRREGVGDRREDRGGPDRRDRRGFRRPVGEPGTDSGAGPSAPEGGDRPPRRDFSRSGDGPRGPRREGDFRGGPRRDGPGGGEGGGRFAPRGGGAPYERNVPYESPYFTATFYPEDTSFATLAKTIRASCRTFELFDIARTVIGKPDRFVVVVQRKPAADAPAGAAPAAKPNPFYISVPDGLPFESDEQAVAHVLGKHLGVFFDTADVEVEAPKGNFQVINKCGVTGELLGPPNYHRYNQIIQQHHATRLPRMSFDAFRAKIETIRDPEVVNQWLEKMKKATRYTWKLNKPAPKPAPEAAAPEAPKPAEGEAVPAAEAAPEAAAPAAPVETVPTFDTLEDARTHLLTHARDKVVRTTENARFHGKVVEQMPQGEIRRAVESTLDRQGRFPLDTANALRGRLRREGFTIFKKGSKGISYVCAVKRKFRVPGQVFADSIGTLIAFIEANPMVKASELPAKFLNIAPAAPAPAPAGDQPAADAAAAAPALTPEQRAQLNRLQGDLAWLVHEGYVTEFIDGRLFAAPPMVEARKKEIESADHDPENFPEAPAEKPAAAPVATSEAPAAPVAEPAPSAEASDSQPAPAT